MSRRRSLRGNYGGRLQCSRRPCNAALADTSRSQALVGILCSHAAPKSHTMADTSHKATRNELLRSSPSKVIERQTPAAGQTTIELGVTWCQDEETQRRQACKGLALTKTVSVLGCQHVEECTVDSQRRASYSLVSGFPSEP
jgi:hypothetical protein